MFIHGIRGDRPRILDGMLDFVDPLPTEFFANLGCPLAPTADEAKVADVHLVETATDPVEGAIVEEQS